MSDDNESNIIMSLVYALEKEGITAFRFDFAGNGWECSALIQLYTSRYHDVLGVINVSGRYKTKRGVEEVWEKVELTKLSLLEKLFLDNNKIMVLPPELGVCEKTDSADVELRQCVGVVELSLEHNKLIHPLLDFRAMAELRILRLSGISAWRSELRLSLGTKANAREEAREREWRQKTNDINSMLRKFSDPRPLIN
ncbi:phospholipase,galactolipase [Artemisia annua]|uniref:Phospholipase,galactolipase n=1 Tax=Artemisia annua TaxID=35608 RepID=A0A2U1LS30_ARTAN|nr:phospholipase,galactolipase [Artemisia annua]